MGLLDRLRRLLRYLKSDPPASLSSISLKFTERYAFDIVKANIPEKKPSETAPSGEISITVPFKQWQQMEKETGKPGFKNVVKLEDYFYTDLDTTLNLAASKQRFPMKEILTQAKAAWRPDEEREAYNRPRVTRLAYKPDQLRSIPVSLEVSIYDDNAVKDADEISKLFRSDEKKEIAEEWVEKIYNLGGFNNSLILEMWVSVKLRKELIKGKEDTVWLESFSLQWPIATSPRQVSLFIVDTIEIKEAVPANVAPEEEEHKEIEEVYRRQNIFYEKPILYDPETESISWTNIPLDQFASSGEDDEVIELSTLPMLLYIQEPGEFYQQKEVTGECRISVETLLSGLKLKQKGNLFGDRRKQRDISRKSELKVGLTLHIEELFRNRNYSPYQILHFPNLILNGRRLADIFLMLKDMRLRYENIRLEERPSQRADLEGNGRSSNADHTPNNAYRKHFIAAERSDGSGQLKLWLILEGFESSTQREKEIEGKETFTTGFPAGKTNLYLRGQLAGDSVRIVQVLTEIQDRLKERFRYVSTLK